MNKGGVFGGVLNSLVKNTADGNKTRNIASGLASRPLFKLMKVLQMTAEYTSLRDKLLDSIDTYDLSVLLQVIDGSEEVGFTREFKNKIRSHVDQTFLTNDSLSHFITRLDSICHLLDDEEL